jgi:hypothetical protein
MGKKSGSSQLESINRKSFGRALTVMDFYMQCKLSKLQIHLFKNLVRKDLKRADKRKIE